MKPTVTLRVFPPREGGKEEESKGKEAKEESKGKEAKEESKGKEEEEEETKGKEDEGERGLVRRLIDRTSGMKVKKTYLLPFFFFFFFFFQLTFIFL